MLWNETNESVMSLSSSKIKSLKNDMLQRLGLSGRIKSNAQKIKTLQIL